MDKPLHASDQGTVQAMGCQRGICTQESKYCSFSWKVYGELQEKRPRLDHKKVLFHHDNVPVHSSAVVGAKLLELGFHLVPHSPLFSRFGFFGLLPFPQYEKMSGGKEILLKRGGDCGNECLFCSVGQILLCGRNQQTGAALCAVSQTRKKIKMVYPEKLRSFYFYTDCSTHPRPGLP